MIDPFLGEDIDDAQIIETLGTLLPEFEQATNARQQEILKEIGDLSWKVGPRAGAAIPLLLKCLARDADRETEDTICYALSNCAPLSIEPLIEHLGDASDLVRRRACYSLGLSADRLRDDTSDIKAAVFERLLDSAAEVRKAAASAIGALRDRRQSTIARLIEMASVASEAERAAALHALGRLAQEDDDGDHREAGTPISAAASVIMTGLGDVNAEVRHSACYALEGLRLPAEQHCEIALRLIETDKSPDVQRTAAWQLKRLAVSVDLPDKTARLAELLDKQPHIASDICEMLSKIGPAAKEAVPNLTKALDAEDDYLALEAAEALWNIERRADLILPTLTRLFDNNGEKACDVVTVIGADARPLLPKLLDALARSDYWDLQWAAADAIGCVATGEPETLKVLVDALSHDSGIVRSASANAMAKIGAPAVPILLSTLTTSQDHKLLEWVAEAFSLMGPRAATAAPALREKLPAAQGGLRVWLSIALAKIAGDADAVPVLIELLEEPKHADNWKIACDALAAIGPSAAPAQSILRELASCPVDDIWQAAEAALNAIDRKSS